MSVQFVMVDASNLKMSILAHCQEWQNKLLKLLFEQAYAHLTFLYRYIDESKAKLDSDYMFKFSEQIFMIDLMF